MRKSLKAAVLVTLMPIQAVVAYCSFFIWMIVHQCKRGGIPLSNVGDAYAYWGRYSFAIMALVPLIILLDSLVIKKDKYFYWLCIISIYATCFWFGFSSMSFLFFVNDRHHVCPK